MRVMLSCVGNRDPFGSVDKRTGQNSEGPLLTALWIVEPDLLLLFPSAGEEGTATTKIPDVMKRLEETGFSRDRVAIHPIAPENPADATDVLQAMGEVVPGALADVPEDAELFVSISSGTPQMQQTWFVLSMLGRLRNASLWQVMDPTKLDPEDSPVWPVRIDVLRLPAVLDEVEAAVTGCHFARAARALAGQGNRMQRGPQKSALLALAHVVEAWDLHDRMDYDGCVELLETAGNECVQTPGLEPLSRLAAQQLQVVRAHGERTGLVFAYLMVERRLARNDMIGALLLAVLVLELSVKAGLHPESPEESLWEHIKSAHRRQDPRWVAVEKAAGSFSAVDSIRDHRNDVVHKLRSPDPVRVQRAAAVARAALRNLVSVFDDEIDDNPFNPAAQKSAIREVLDLLRKEPV